MLDAAKLRRQVGLFKWATAILLAIAAALVLLVVWREVFKPPPFYFSQDVYRSTRLTYCPGETVEWTPKLIVTRAPTLLVVARTVWSVPEQRTALPETDPKYFVWTELEQGKPVARPTRLTLPADLKPGPYEIRSAATSFNTDAATYRVPFVVLSGCGPKGD